MTPARSSTRPAAEAPGRADAPRRRAPRPLPALALLAALTACGDAPSPAEPTLPPLLTYEVVRAFPHDPAAFTQGLLYLEGDLLESTGRYGASSLRRVDIESGTVLQRTDLPANRFGEGIAVVGDEVVQLTWQAREGYVYDLDSFEREDTVTYPTEGWGLTSDGTRFVMSDGTSTLYFRDASTFAERGRVEVRDEDGPVTRLNELEWVDGEVYANVWQTDSIARIDPDTGLVLGWIDLTGLLPDSVRTGGEDVLNGIAWDAEGGRLFVTGKLWPRLYEIRLREP